MSFQESNGPIGDSPGDAFRLLLRATLSEACARLQDAIIALDDNDPTAYARAVADFTTVRSTAKEWMDLLNG